MRAVSSILILLTFLSVNVTAQEEKPPTKTKEVAKSANTPNSKKQVRRPTPFWPADTPCNADIPTPRQHFGFEIGFRHLNHAQIVSYCHAIAEASERISITQTGRTHGGRPTLLLTITSPKNRKRLKQIRSQHLSLAKGNATRIAPDLPAVINMGYGVHGDEPSATNCSPLVLHYLAAARGEQIERILDRCVILLDPSLNPDGFNRFANWVNRYRGRVLNPDPQHAEHSQQWPPGRVNYYWFDLNRDWLPLVHPESRNRMKWYHAWKPNVVLDFHEMGTNSTFFFQPGIPQRTNPLTPTRNVELTRKFGQYHAKALDRKGSLYFTQERFDDFYMGKGSTYPDLHGSVGILFEQASSRGHMQKNQDGLLRFADTISNQFATSLSSLNATADLRNELLRHKRSFYQQAIKLAAKSKTQTYLFSCPRNPARLKAFSDTLLRHDIQCFQLREDLEYGDQTISAEDTIVVPVAQSEYRFLMSLLMTRTNFKENIFYDVSSWTLPLAYGLEQKSLTRTLDQKLLQPVELATEMKPIPQWPDDAIGFLVDWRNDQAVPLLAKLQRNQIKVRVAKKPFKTEDQRSFPRGTLFVPLATQKAKSKKIRQLLAKANREGQPIFPVTTGLTPVGIDLGSPNFPVIEQANVAMLTGRPVSAYNAGAIWHHLDTRVGMRVTMLKPNAWGTADLGDYTTLIIPSGRYNFSEKESEQLQEFLNEGGNIIAMGRSVSTVGQKIGKLKDFIVNTDSQEDSPESADDKAKDKKKKKEPIQKPFGSASDTRALELISGAIFETKADTTHPLLYGLNKKSLPVFRTHTTFLKPSKNAYNNPLVYPPDQVLLAGYCSKKNIDKAKNAASAVVYPSGRGKLILLSEESTFRGFWHGTARVLMNAILFGDEM